MAKKNIPLAPSFPVLGSLPDIPTKDMYNSFLEKYGDIFQYKEGPLAYVMISHPDYIKYVLQDNSINYKKSIIYDELKQVLRQGIVTSEGEFWRQQRKLIQPTFHKHRISRFAEIMGETCNELVEEWSGKEGQVIDICAEMKKLTMAIVSLVIFNKDLSHSASKLGTALDKSLEFVKSTTHLPFWIHARKTMAFNQNFSFVKKTVLNIISERRKTPGEICDLMDMLIAAQDEETGVGMSDQQLFDEIITLFYAGHETTSQTLIWTWYLLAQHSDVREKLHREVDEKLNGKIVELTDLPNLPYSLMVLKESMRYLPAICGIGRTTIKDDDIDGYHIPAGSEIAIPICQMHRHPKYWTDPDLFNPERFLDKDLEKKNRWVYLPFGGGPRQCIGNNFALLETQIIVSMIVRKFKLSMLSTDEVRLNHGITLSLSLLRPEKSILMRIKSRNKD